MNKSCKFCSGDEIQIKDNNSDNFDTFNITDKSLNIDIDGFHGYDSCIHVVTEIQIKFCPFCGRNLTPTFIPRKEVK